MSLSIDSEARSSKSFHYSDLDAETLDFMQQQTREIRLLMKRTARDIINIGQKLTEIKKRLGHGKYRKWIEAEFNWSKSTANSFENVAKQFANVQNLDIFTPSVLYELAAPSTPETARQEAIGRASQGEKISFKSAKEIKKKHLLKSGKLKPDSDRKSEAIDAKVFLEPQKHQISALEIGDIASPNNSRYADPLPKQTQETTNSESWWQLGKKHLLYCGDPHSPELQSQLPEKIALAIVFSPTASWSLGNLKSRINSSLVLFSHYQDLDFKSLREIVRNALELYTNDRETVLFCFLPDPILLVLAEQLGCCCSIAEPDFVKCQNLLKAWTQIGETVKTLKTLDFPLSHSLDVED